MEGDTDFLSFTRSPACLHARLPFFIFSPSERDTYNGSNKEAARFEGRKRCHSRHVYYYLHSCCENQNYTQSINEQILSLPFSSPSFFRNSFTFSLSHTRSLARSFMLFPSLYYALWQFVYP